MSGGIVGATKAPNTHRRACRKQGIGFAVPVYASNLRSILGNEQALYTGTGSIDEAENFTCRLP